MNKFEITEYIKNPLQERLGKEYFNNGYVYSFEYDGDTVSTKVGILSNVYSCSFQVEKDKIKNLKCSCLETNCAHLAASLLAYKTKEYKSMYPFRGKDFIEIRRREIHRMNLQRMADEATQFIFRTKSQYHAYVENQVKSDKYSLEPVLEKPFSLWELSFKVGASKKYVVKNIDNFLESVHSEKEVKYGKNLSFVHTRNSFDEQAISQIDFMEKVQANNQKKILGIEIITILKKCLRYVKP